MLEWGEVVVVATEGETRKKEGRGGRELPSPNTTNRRGCDEILQWSPSAVPSQQGLKYILAAVPSLHTAPASVGRGTGEEGGLLWVEATRPTN